MTRPDPAFEFIGTDPNDDTQASSGTTKTVSLEVLSVAATGRYSVVQYGADPTGATECHSSIQAAINAAAADPSGSGTVFFPPGNYLISAGFSLPSNVALVADWSAGGTVTSTKSGAVLVLSSSFTSSAVLSISDSTTTHASTTGTTLRGLMIYGANHTSSTVHGISITGPCMNFFSDLRICQMSGWGIMTALDNSASEIGPYGQTWNNVEVDSCVEGGISLNFCEDSVFINVYAIGNNGGDGFYINSCDNTKFVGCNSEWNSANGFHVTGDWTWAQGDCQFIGCSTDANSNNGWLIDATWTTGQGAGTGPNIILLSGCFARRDGKANTGASGTYAGFSIGNTNLPVVINGFGTMPSVGDGGAGNMSPRYGIYFNATPSTTPIVINGGIAWGYSNGVYSSLSGGAAPAGVTQSAVTQVTGTDYGYAY
jgi:hypothetical protein